MAIVQNVLKKKLCLAISQENIESAKRQISQGVHVNFYVSEYRETPLHIAVESLNVPLVNLLLDAGANVNARNVRDATPLHHLLVKSVLRDVNDSYHRVLQLLVSRGANVNAVDVNGSSVLNIAALSGHTELVRSLLGHGADVHVHDNRYHGPLHYAISGLNSAKTPSVMELLIKHGCDVNYPQKPVLHLACQRFCSTKVLKFLIDNGAHPNAVNSEGIVPIFYLVRYHYDWNLMRFMLKYTDVNFQTTDGRNILNFENFICHWESIVRHIAKLRALDRHVRPELVQTIESQDKYKRLHDKCAKELKRAKDTNCPECRLTFFHLLTIDGNKLINVVGNEDLVKDVEKRRTMFRYYRDEITRRVRMAVSIRERRDECATLLEECVPTLPSVALQKILDFVFQYDEDD